MTEWAKRNNRQISWVNFGIPAALARCRRLGKAKMFSLSPNEKENQGVPIIRKIPTLSGKDI